MKKCQLTLAVLLLALFLTACAPSEPSISEPSPKEILHALEKEVNEKDLEGTMELFAEDAVVEKSFKNLVYDNPKEIEGMWKTYYYMNTTCEFRDIVVDGDTAEFALAILYDQNTYLTPVTIEVHNGKIIYMDLYEDETKVPIEEE